jgi:hypothetical protein
VEVPFGHGLVNIASQDHFEDYDTCSACVSRKASIPTALLE